MKRLFSILIAFALVSPAFAQKGEGWTSKTIADGITYLTFSGFDEVSGANQEIFVLDWDMSNPSYALRYTWTDKAVISSGVHRRENAVATLNAAYEPISVVAKVGGYYHSCMPRDTVMETPVFNWKSEAAIYTDASGQKVKIAFDGKGKSIAEQRAFYAASPWENWFIFSNVWN